MADDDSNGASKFMRVEEDVSDDEVPVSVIKKRGRPEEQQGFVSTRPAVKRDRGDLMIISWASGSFCSFAAPREYAHVRAVEDIILAILAISETSERKKTISMFLNAMKERIVTAQPSTNACVFAVGMQAYSTLGMISKDDLKWWRTDAHKENNGQCQYVVYTFSN